MNHHQKIHAFYKNCILFGLHIILQMHYLDITELLSTVYIYTIDVLQSKSEHSEANIVKLLCFVCTRGVWKVRSTVVFLSNR